MAQQSKLDVNKWQAARRQFQYTPVLWFYYRMIEVAFLDARSKVYAEGPLRPHEKRLCRPGDDALLARDWIARSESLPPQIGGERTPREYVSFPECCQMLNLDADVERVAMLETIDRAVDTDDDEAWARLEELSASEPLDDVEPLFDAPRCVPALDQMSLF
jgi:hypothetical protein